MDPFTNMKFQGGYMNCEEWLALPKKDMLDKWYQEQYRKSTYGGLAGLGQKFAHASLERNYNSSHLFETVLEVGGNVGEHLPFVRHSFKKYILSDLNMPVIDPAFERHSSGLVSCIQADVEALPLADLSVDRVLSTCVFHHVNNPEQAFSEVHRVLKQGGRADILLPSDPGFLYRLGRGIGPKRTARQAGLGDVKSLVDARDHINHVHGLLRLARHVFRSDHIEARTFPIVRLTWNTSLWTSLRVSKSLN
jgi:phosphatidylethanolamine/phosphatidyl-N-methylethanolamine N-methyltransferase